MRILLVFSLFFVFLSNINAQITYSHSAGASIFSSKNVISGGINYSPRINIIKLDENLTFSLGSHIAIGMPRKVNGVKYLDYDLPFVAELNFGQGAKPGAGPKLGGFIGAGFGINKMGSKDSISIFNNYNDASGIVINGGLRLLINDMPCGFRISYLINGKKQYNDVFIFGIFFTLGDF